MTDATGQRLTSPSPAIAGLVFVFGFWLLFSALLPNQNLQNIRQDVIVVVAEWFTVIVLFAIVVLWERLPFLSSVGLTPPARADWMLVGFFLLLAIAASTFLAVRHVTISVKGTMAAQLVGLPLWIRVSAVFSAGVCEEILFRGYAIERLKSLTGNIWIGGLIGPIFFTLAHLPRYGLSPGLLGVALLSVIFSLIYIWRRNLAGCVALHWFLDGFNLLILPPFLTLK